MYSEVCVCLMNKTMSACRTGEYDLLSISELLSDNPSKFLKHDNKKIKPVGICYATDADRLYAVLYILRD